MERVVSFWTICPACEEPWVALFVQTVDLREDVPQEHNITCICGVTFRVRLEMVSFQATLQ